MIQSLPYEDSAESYIEGDKDEAHLSEVLLHSRTAKERRHQHKASAIQQLYKISTKIFLLYVNSKDYNCD